MQRIGPPKPQGIRTLVYVGAGNDKVRNLGRLHLHLLANLEHVVVEQPDNIHGTQDQDLPSCRQGKAASIKVVVNAGGDSIVTKAGKVDLVFMNIRRDHRFGHSGA